LGGTQEIFIGVSEDLLGGTGKAEVAKSAGRRNYPETVPDGKGRNEGDGPKTRLKSVTRLTPVLLRVKQCQVGSPFSDCKRTM